MRRVRCVSVRLCAQCFNFWFPQEIDKEFIIIWDGFTDPPWKTVKEDELRKFLFDRAREGFSFPLNPVWPVRDRGWYDILNALQQHSESIQNFQSWFPPSSGILEKISRIHSEFPYGFTPAPPPPPGSRLRDGSPSKPLPPPLPSAVKGSDQHLFES